MTDIGIDHNNPSTRGAPPPITPGALLCTIPQAAAFICRGTRFVYEAIATGQIKAVKSDKRTLVVVESLREYVAALVPAIIKPMPMSNAARNRKRREAQARVSGNERMK
jgi:hypothetical protein